MNAAILYQRRGRLIYAPVALLAVLAFFVLSSVWLPLPPSEVTISAGRPGGMYHEHAHAYRKLLQEWGINLQIQESAGTGQNLQRLRDPANTVQIALAQGGYDLDKNSDPYATGIQTLAHVDIEPIWVFSRFQDVDSLLRLQGQRVSIGQEGSGSRDLALRLLSQVRLEPKDLLESEVAGSAIVQALRNGKIDAAIFVAAAKAPVVQTLLSTPGIYLANLKRSAALSERMPYLEARFASAGSLSASGLQPPEDRILLSTVASLLVREDLHPMIKRALTHVALLQHAGPGSLHRANEFPHLKRLEFPSAPEARTVLREGLPWIEEHIPLQVAQWLYRLAWIGLPLTLLALWICWVLPRYLVWRIDHRINMWYGELKFIENDLNLGKPGGLEIAQFRARLRGISTGVANFPMPKNYMQRVFILRQHVALVNNKIQSRTGR
jgi:uncharacterized protein